MKKFNYNLFYKLITRKIKKDIDIFELIKKCNGFNVLEWTGVKREEDVVKVFYDNFFEERNYDSHHIFSGTYLKDLNENIDCIPIAVTRKKFWSSDKVRNYDLNKLIINYAEIVIFFKLTFKKKKNAVFTRLYINQTNQEFRSIVEDPLNATFKTISKFASNTNIKKFNSSIIDLTDIIVPNLSNFHELVLNSDFVWDLKKVEKLYKKEHFSPKILILDRTNLLSYFRKGKIYVMDNKLKHKKWTKV